MSLSSARCIAAPRRPPPPPRAAPRYLPM
jgi:hypothetical protein